MSQTNHNAQIQAVHINSANRLSSSLSSDEFTVQFSPPLVFGYSSIETVFLPVSFYNVSSDPIRCIMYHRDSLAHDTTVTITAGNYTVATLCSAICTQINNGVTDGSVVTAVQSTITGLVTFTSTISCQWGWTSAPGLGRMLGFYADNTATTSVATRVPSLYTETVFVYCDELDSHAVGPNGFQQPIVAAIPISSNPGSYVSWSATAPNWVYHPQQKHLNQLSFKLRDKNGVRVNLNGTEWSLTLLLR